VYVCVCVCVWARGGVSTLHSSRMHVHEGSSACLWKCISECTFACLFPHPCSSTETVACKKPNVATSTSSYVKSAVSHLPVCNRHKRGRALTTKASRQEAPCQERHDPRASFPRLGFLPAERKVVSEGGESHACNVVCVSVILGFERTNVHDTFIHACSCNLKVKIFCCGDCGT
jgi:hypothetical protein